MDIASDLARSTLPAGIQPFRACRTDPRLSYTALVPPAATTHPVPATVVVHGSLRTPEHYRDALADYAERTGSVVIAPLFPCGLTGEDDTESYKFVLRDGIRFDLALLDMVAQVEAEWPERLASGPFLLHGFSGGGQFAHRFAYLHPHRLAALSVGAPGNVTVPDDALPWWRGTGGLADLAGTPLDLAALRRLPVQLVIGAEDTDEAGVLTAPGSPHWMEGINEAGRDRRTLLRTLETALRAHGVDDLTVDVVPGVAHEGFRVLGQVEAFFEAVLARRSGAGEVAA